VTGGTRFCTVALNVFGYSVWNLLYSFVGNGLKNFTYFEDLQSEKLAC
jgi:hypothetical protein